MMFGYPHFDPSVAAIPGGLGRTGQPIPSSIMPGEWDWMQDPMMMAALMGAGGMFGQQGQAQPFGQMQAPPMPPPAMGRTTPVQLMQQPQTPLPQQRQPWWLQHQGGMFG